MMRKPQALLRKSVKSLAAAAQQPGSAAVPERPEKPTPASQATTASEAAATASGDIAAPASGAGAAGPELPMRRAEGLEAAKVTPRVLRRARRKARLMGIEARDDHEALRILEDMGIDVMTPDRPLLGVAGGTAARAEAPPAEEDRESQALEVGRAAEFGRVGQPGAGVIDQSERRGTAYGFVSDDERAAEIEAIQRGLVQRRRKRLAFLFVKLLFFVLLPTGLVGYYYYFVASDLYETRSAFVIQTAEAAGQGGGAIGGLFAGTGFANAKDSIVVQDFLTSREAMLRLDREHGYISHFQQPWLDPIRRLAPDASAEDAYRMYRRNVVVGFDTSEGVLRMTVVAADPETSQRFAEALVGYAEERVDQLSARARLDQMAGAIEGVEEAEAAVQAAQNRVLELQERRGVLSAEAEITSQMNLINMLEVELENKRLELAGLLENPTPNPTRVSVAEGEIQRLENRVRELRTAMIQDTDATASLAVISGELRIAEADLATRQLMLQQAMQQLETARIDANRQVRYLSVGVSPVAPDRATYPRKMENTALAFLVLLSIYLLVSLTISILREQVSV